jgi:Xaa-Pro aminopeptidase
MRRRRLDSYLSVRLSNIRYLTGFTGSDAALLITSRGITSSPTAGTMSRPGGGPGAEVVITDRKWAEVPRRLRLAGSRRIGYEAAHMTVESFRRFSRERAQRWVYGKDLVEPLRMRKEPGEVLAIEAAAAAAAASLLSLLSAGVEGKRERDVAADLEREMKRRGAEGPSFPPIVADGARSAMPHAQPTGNRIGRRCRLRRFGARKGGYSSDETVTILPCAPAGRSEVATRPAAQEAGFRPCAWRPVPPR